MERVCGGVKSNLLLVPPAHPHSDRARQDSEKWLVWLCPGCQSGRWDFRPALSSQEGTRIFGKEVVKPYKSSVFILFGWVSGKIRRGEMVFPPLKF